MLVVDVSFYVACEFSQIQKGGAKDGFLALLSISESTIPAMKFSDDKYNSEVISNNRSSVILHGTCSSMLLVYNETESGLAPRIITIYADGKVKTGSVKYGGAGTRYNSKLFRNQREADGILKYLARIYWNIWLNHHAFREDYGATPIPIDGLEYYYDKSDIEDSKILWIEEQISKTGQNKVDMTKYVPPTHLIRVENGKCMRNDTTQIKLSQKIQHLNKHIRLMTVY